MSEHLNLTSKLSAACDITQVIAHIILRQSDCRLTLSHNEQILILGWQQGQLVAAHSDVVLKKLQKELATQGRITQAQYQQLRGLQSSELETGLKWLVDQGLVPAKTCEELACSYLHEVFCAFLSTRLGDIIVKAGPCEMFEHRPFTDARALLLDGLRQLYSQPLLEQVLGSPKWRLMLQGPVPDALGLTTQERSVLPYLCGAHSMAQAAAAAEVPLQVVMALALVLVRLELASVAEDLRAWAPTSLVHSASDLAAPTTDTMQLNDSSQAAFERALTSAYEHDYFTVLGLLRGATPPEVAFAALALGAQFAPHNWPEEQKIGRADDLAEILAVVTDAREVLLDASRGPVYRRSLDAAGAAHVYRAADVALHGGPAA